MEVADGSSHGVGFRLCGLRELRVRIQGTNGTSESETVRTSSDGVAGLSGDGLRGARRGARGVARGALRAPAAGGKENDGEQEEESFHGCSSVEGVEEVEGVEKEYSGFAFIL